MDNQDQNTPPAPRQVLLSRIGDAIYDLGRLKSRHEWDEDTFLLMRIKNEELRKALQEISEAR